jgi:hypothetical protein
LFLIYLISEAIAGEAEHSEHLRLSVELQQAITQGNTAYAESVFAQLLAYAPLGEVLTRDDWWYGAEAARMLGKADLWRERLFQGLKLSPDERLSQTLGYIDNNFGRVELVASGPIELQADSLLDPDQQRVVEAVKNQLWQGEAYTGLLPVGSYRLGDTSFTVAAGTQVRVQLRQEEPELQTQRGLCLVLGGAFASTTMGSLTGMEGGLGFRLVIENLELGMMADFQQLMSEDVKASVLGARIDTGIRVSSFYLGLRVDAGAAAVKAGETGLVLAGVVPKLMAGVQIGYSLFDISSYQLRLSAGVQGGLLVEQAFTGVVGMELVPGRRRW